MNEATPNIVALQAAQRDLQPETGISLADVTPQAVNWLWDGRIASGKLTLIDGDPGLGKSVVVLDWCARWSRGARMPDGAPSTATGVVLVPGEDDLADTIVPRLLAAGADLARIRALPTVRAKDGSERMLALPDDIDIIERTVDAVEATVLVVDPVMAFLSSKLSAGRDQESRQALSPLRLLAARKGIAVIAVRHLTKGSIGMSAVYRGGGSMGFIGLARGAYLVAPDPDDPDARIVAPIKSNLAALPPSLSYRLRGDGLGSVRAEWGPQGSFTADSLLAAKDEDHEVVREAREMLLDILPPGEAIPASRVEDERKARNLSKYATNQAKARLGVSVRRIGGSLGMWTWCLPAPTNGPDSLKCLVSTPPVAGQRR